MTTTLYLHGMKISDLKKSHMFIAFINKLKKMFTHEDVYSVTRKKCFSIYWGKIG